VISLALCAGAAALAADEDAPRSRAEVIAERDAAFAAGTIAVFSGVRLALAFTHTSD
jgi:hypothetical protein